MLFISALSPKALELLRELQHLSVLNDFYLVGGTALALKYGHRLSIDLDFFTAKEFDTRKVIDSLSGKFSMTVLSQATNSLTLDIASVKTDFIRHNYPLLNQVVEEEGIKMASVEDIAAMKLNSLMNRGSKKDFFDIYELLNHFTLEQLLGFHSRKYDFSSQLILLKSLVYFDDAENEPDPVLNKPVNWLQVKQKLNDVVGLFSKR